MRIMESARVFLMLLLIILAPASASVGKGGRTLHAPDAYASSSEAPTTQWIKTYGEANTVAEAYSLIQTSDDGYALAGFIGTGYSDAWLVKTDSSGTMQWNKTYGGATNSDKAFSVVQTGDGGYALAGYTDSLGAGGNDAWLVKTDSSGTMQWNKTYGGAKDDEAHCLVQTSDDGYALAGWTNSFGAGSNDFWLIKTDSAGNVQWNKTYGGANADEASSVVQTGDGGYALAGWTDSFGVGGFWLVRTDGIGNVKWSKSYGGYGGAFSVIQTRDEGYAAAGATSSLGAGENDFWLVKADLDGNVQWNQTYGGTGDDWGFSVVQTADGGYAVAGRMARPLPDLHYDFGLVKVAGENASSPATGFDWNSAEGYVVVGVVVTIATVAAWLVLVRRRRAKGPDDEKV